MSGQGDNAGSQKGRSRRRFLSDSARSLTGLGLLGLGLGLYGTRARSHAPEALRPPGALAEEEFLGACLRCGLCVRDCPYDTLKLATLTDPVANGTPYFTAREVPCEMCDDIPCVAACPSGALAPTLTDIDEARMGLAVLIDRETCLNVLGLRCDVCYRVCPLIDEAITLEMEHDSRTGHHARFIPTVHSDACTGCGKCEQACVLEEAAIKVVPLHLAKGQIGGHYRLGWKEKEANDGESLIPDVLKLPERRPEGGQ
ncbi:ferredoxin-type protein NapG [Motiliproteus sp. SC1-56]|uniref:ferredoxin-type protein NapG n=1 Tax=Motiliproteus sp. SC1-56 TaxID=2799565 RepID=UPI001A8ED980|nr:ferredoxin-type protein NapG [Motiliproteus sp. SC1-56]